MFVGFNDGYCSTTSDPRLVYKVSLPLLLVVFRTGVHMTYITTKNIRLTQTFIMLRAGDHLPRISRIMEAGIAMPPKKTRRRSKLQDQQSILKHSNRRITTRKLWDTVRESKR